MFSLYILFMSVDESGSDSDGAESTSSSYSSLSDFVMDIQNSEISGESPVGESLWYKLILTVCTVHLLQQDQSFFTAFDSIPYTYKITPFSDYGTPKLVSLIM